MEELKNVLARIFREYRKRSGYSQWKLSIIAKIHPRSIQKIERGELQPGVMLVVRLVSAMGSNVGFFFADLAKEANLIRHEIMPRLWQEVEEEEEAWKECKCLFGPFFRQIRTANRITQQTICDATGYTLRNILNTEKGRQEPAVMTALSMVAVTGVDIGIFFNRLACIQNKFEKGE